MTNINSNYKIGMISLGCPKNQVDGEILLEKLNSAGFQIVSEIPDSDIMIINTCGFIDAAKQSRKRLTLSLKLPNTKRQDL